jgi:hypothetical protein
MTAKGSLPELNENHGVKELMTTNNVAEKRRTRPRAFQIDSSSLENNLAARQYFMN